MQASQAATGRETGPGAVVAGDTRGKLNADHPGLRRVQNTAQGASVHTVSPGVLQCSNQNPLPAPRVGGRHT